MDRDRELDRLVALLEEHELIPDYEDDLLSKEKPWGHRLIYQRVRQTPFFPMSVAEVRDLLEPRPSRFASSRNERDDAAGRRDRVAELRDHASHERDRAAYDRVRADGRFAIGEREQAARDREAAARDRAAASRDREQAARDREEAGVDGLTGALRRDRGLADLEREIDRARRADGQLVLAFIDVDGLKVINDVHGHAAGDQLLREVGAALITGLRSYDLVVRYGGDEFLCVLPGTDIQGARRRLDQLARNLTGMSPRASLSMGLAALEDPDTLDELTARADAALYAARGGARGRAESPGATALLKATTATRQPLAASPGAGRSSRHQEGVARKAGPLQRSAAPLEIHQRRRQSMATERGTGGNTRGIGLGGILVIVGIVVMVVWSFLLGLVITLVGLIAFGGFAKGKWY